MDYMKRNDVKPFRNMLVPLAQVRNSHINSNHTILLQMDSAGLALYRDLRCLVKTQTGSLFRFSWFGYLSFKLHQLLVFAFFLAVLQGFFFFGGFAFFAGL